MARAIGIAHFPGDFLLITQGLQAFLGKNTACPQT
jgi:hypothetical protein